MFRIETTTTTRAIKNKYTQFISMTENLKKIHSIPNILISLITDDDNDDDDYATYD
ncbi:hypothetical protein PIROE2DRAFT_15465 [Piromyces sp. E2]|nr:hypothetical protein PIROE2DRAFT_15465 [Piromyces sp. E2]|eukprot:OUM59108.1 hypothetical protein PIROE2DRAFT_15465 [Piromyces sp. E2]